MHVAAILGFDFFLYLSGVIEAAIYPIEVGARLSVASKYRDDVLGWLGVVCAGLQSPAKPLCIRVEFELRNVGLHPETSSGSGNPALWQTFVSS